MKHEFNSGKFLMGAGLVLMLGALSLVVYNRLDTIRADRTAEKIVGQFEAQENDLSGLVGNYKAANGDIPDDQLMTLTIDGRAYIGILEIESLGIKVPVQAGWSYSQLNTSPCRYEGSPKKGGFVIAGYNYEHQFGLLKLLKEGTAVRFTDIEGTEYDYTVSKLEKSGDRGVKNVEADNWDLTLFTCTVQGSTRYTARCRENIFQNGGKAE